MRTPTIPHSGPAAPSALFSISATVTLEDRMSAALFGYRDLFAAARRRVLYGLIWALLALLAVAGFSAWQVAGGDGIGAAARHFATDITGIGGLPFLVIGLPALFYYAVQPGLVRRRLRRWYRDEQLDQPLSVQYRFEPGGLVSAAGGQTSRISCSRIGGVAEEARHLFIRIKDDEEILALPMSALADADCDRARSWARACHAEGPNADAPFDAAASCDETKPLFTTRFTLTEADRAVALRWQMERPGMRRRRMRGALTSLVLVTLAPAALIALLWALDPDRVPFAYAAPLFVEMLGSTLLPWMLGAAAIVIAAIIVHPWLRSRHAGQLARLLHARGQAYEHEVRLYEDRLETTQLGLSNQFAWSSFARFERQGAHILLCRRQGEPLILPLRALGDEGLAVFEGIVQIGPGSGGKRPETSS